MGLEGFRVIRPTVSSDGQGDSWFNIGNIDIFIIIFYMSIGVFTTLPESFSCAGCIVREGRWLGGDLPSRNLCFFSNCKWEIAHAVPA